MVPVRRSEDNLKDYFYHVGAREETQVIKLGGKCFYQLDYLNALTPSVYNHCVYPNSLPEEKMFQYWFICLLAK